MRDDAARAIAIDTAMSDRRVTPIDLRIVAVLALATVLDAFDIFLVGPVAPAIAAEFGVPSSQMALVFTMQQFGMAIGCFTVGMLSDRYGPRRILILSLTGFAALTLACLVARNLVQFAVLRGLSGVLLGGVLPIATTLMSEFAPTKARGRLMATILAGYSAGPLVAALSAAWLLEPFGWRGGFVVGGLSPIVCLVLVMAFVPESVQFRARRNSSDPSVGRTLSRMNPSLALRGDETFAASASGDVSPRPRLADVFSGGRGWRTLALWMVFILAMGSYVMVSSWLPAFFKEMANVPIQDFAHVLVFASFGGIAGVLSIGVLMDRFPMLAVLIACYVGEALALLALAFTPFGTPLFPLLLGMKGFFGIAGTCGMVMFASLFYPPAVRTTGVGVAIGAGRIGGIISPLIGGAILAANLGIKQSFLLISLPTLGVILLLTLLALSRPLAGPRSE